MAEQFGDKTEAPTQKRKRDARKDGNVLKSRDLATALVVLAGAGWMTFFGPQLIAAIKEVMTASFSFGHADVEDFAPWRPLAAAGWKLAPALGALFGITVMAAVASQAALGGVDFNGGLLAPKASRINPAAGLKRMLGTHGWTELGKSLLKVALLGAIGATMLWKIAHTSIALVHSDVRESTAALGGTFTSLLLTMALGLAAIALLDVPLQLIQLLGKLRMTKQEVKDEHKESEGNPEVKAQRRARARALASGGVRKAVAEAHVVLTNPTHFAVALRYDRGRDQVPVVVAKGRGESALAIREMAAACGTQCLEYPQLARAVYYTSREGQEVRDDLYLAIATVLAFVFGVNAAAGGSPPPVDVPAGARFDEHGHKQG